MKSIVMFNQAIEIAVETLKPFGAVFGNDIILIRDLLGRIRIILRGKRDNYRSSKPEKMADALSEALGAYAYPSENQVLFSADLMEADRLFDSDERHLLHEEDGCRLWLIDRQLMGLDWSRAPFERQFPTRRVTFFGIKGGVGRSTALVVGAWKLAKAGKTVLIMDLDLESPGISSTLLPQPFLPDYGIVDWFVEDAVGQGEAVTRAMIADSPLARDLAGRIRVVPAYGSVNPETTSRNWPALTWSIPGRIRRYGGCAFCAWWSGWNRWSSRMWSFWIAGPAFMILRR